MTIDVVKTHAYKPRTTDLESKKAKDSCEPWLGKSISTSQKRIRQRLWEEQLSPEAGTFFKALCPSDHKEKEKSMLSEVI